MDIDPRLFQENERLTPSAAERQLVSVGSLNCSAGGYLHDIQVAYQTWGQLNNDASNAVLICHALSGDSNAAGWWDQVVGPGKAIDTNVYFVIGTNALGGCQGTTGPSSLHPDGNPYGSRFPIITVQDMMVVQNRLIQSLGISQLMLIAGGSMGGMQALSYAKQFPGQVRHVWVTASCARHSAMQIAFNEAGRQAIMRDPRWNGGNYDPNDQPSDGLAVARMVGHISYLSEASFEKKFSRSLQDKEKFSYHHGVEFQVESYLNYQGDKFTSRFDANSFLVLTKAIDYFDLEGFQGCDASFLFTSFDSDWLYPTHQSQQMLADALAAGCNAEHHEISLPYGHDAFLLDGVHQGAILKSWLDKTEP
ncbi:homoserine O-acetyltransferase [Kamptonema cortianum]|nr:homoserine O-acetyltransferase [Geitlerinema splendidum]MDK3156076.1 homoserine O-acetyltransferase [Kamptonema cortianum]